MSLKVRESQVAGAKDILTDEALAFVEMLVARFAPRIGELLLGRRQVAARYDAGERPRFLPETESVRRGDWRVGELPADLCERTVEITGPVDRKMIINALNSGANVFMADFEDSLAPSWQNVVEGQVNLRDAVRGTIAYQDPESGKRYALGPRPAVLLVRPRGLHLPEAHVTRDGAPVPGCLFDFGLYFFHNVAALRAKGTGPYFYLPKMQSHLEARLWNEVFVAAETALGVPVGTIKMTALIETLHGAFEMDEILYELRDHAAGLNCGRWDYIFSFIKTLRADPKCVLPDRSEVTMTQPFMRAYTQLLIQTCHRRGAFAMGGMAAQIPIKGDPAANEAALAKVRADKLREVEDGHDGTWVAHPGLVPIAMEVFRAHMPGKNQLARLRQDVHVTAEDLLSVPTGKRTDAGLRHNIRVGIRYLEAWLRGNGCVPLYNLMEDAATAEISRTQLWQWLKHGAKTDDGVPVTAERVARAVEEELAVVGREVGPEAFAGGRYAEARELFVRIATDTSSLPDFLTLGAYELLTKTE
ncbi:MAG: malate synthase A [Polyangiaceae bacterium]|nr:malate synthase A [Polyangiaceae bacterium]